MRVMRISGSPVQANENSSGNSAEAQIKKLEKQKAQLLKKLQEDAGKIDPQILQQLQAQIQQIDMQIAALRMNGTQQAGAAAPRQDEKTEKETEPTEKGDRYEKLPEGRSEESSIYRLGKDEKGNPKVEYEMPDDPEKTGKKRRASASEDERKNLSATT